MERLKPLNSSDVIRVDIYSKKDCHLCEIAKEVIRAVQKKIPFELIETDITTSPELETKYKEEIPVIFINSTKAFKYHVTEEEFTRKLMARKQKL